MAEAAEAIRRPKSAVQKEQASDNQSAADSSENSDEVRAVTKLPESEGAVGGNNTSSLIGSGEIQEDNQVTQEEK
uniref:Uncharacterized protein n=1 Tax=Lotus japonicus TaxID=34305 RepID=I3T408_LOTJA|nr:unknown [Lotus japonicus]